MDSSALEPPLAAPDGKRRQAVGSTSLNDVRDAKALKRNRKVAQIGAIGSAAAGRVDPGARLPVLPAWSRVPVDGKPDTQTALFSAGIALHALDGVIRAAPAWLGALAMRQAVLAAEAGARLLRLGADAQRLRDEVHWHRAGEVMGEAGRLHALLRFIAGRSPRIDGRLAQRIAEALGLALADGRPSDLAASSSSIDEGDERDGRASAPINPVSGALLAGKGFYAADVASFDNLADCRALDFAALLIADIALARRLGWPCTIPIITAACANASFKDAGGKRIRPDHPDWTGAASMAYAHALHAAYDQARLFVPRAEALLCAKLRTKGRAGALAAILAEDCVKANALTMLGSERAAHRMLDTLTKQGVLRELTGRHVFRLYGL